MPRNGLPAAIASRIGSISPRRRSSAMASGNAPTPGSTIRSAAASTAGSLRDGRGVPDFLEAFLDAPQIAHLIVDDGEHG